VGVHKIVHGLKLFRPHHCENQITAQRDGNDSKNDVFHKIELEFFAAERVKCERRKKQDRRADVDHVQHNFTNTRNAAMMNATTPQHFYPG
jgi:hypothetical protein